jgi:hypothetical protein
MNRALFSTTTTSGTSSGIVSTNTVAVRGNAARIGGFYFFARFGVETYGSSTSQYIIGLSASNAAITGEPSAIANTVGLCKDSSDTTWQLVFRNASAVTKVNTGETVTAGNVYDLTLFCNPNDTIISVRLVRRNDDTVIIDNTSYSANLPVNTTFLYASAQVRTTAARLNALALNRIYVECDI